jgi:hypothetical protein
MKTKSQNWIKDLVQWAVNSFRRPKIALMDDPFVRYPEVSSEEEIQALADLNSNQPAWLVVRYFLFAHVQRNLETAFDHTQSVETQLEFKNRAAGVTAVLQDLAGASDRAVAELERRRAKQAAAAKQKKG